MNRWGFFSSNRDLDGHSFSASSPIDNCDALMISAAFLTRLLVWGEVDVPIGQTNPAMGSKKITFLCLPSELRSIVYRYYLAPMMGCTIEISERCSPKLEILEYIYGSFIYDYDEQIAGKQIELEGTIIGKTVRDQMKLGLLRTNRQINLECSHLLYGSNHFYFKDWSIFHCFVRKCRPPTLHFIKKIELWFPLSEDPSPDHFKCSSASMKPYSWPEDAHLFLGLLRSLQHITLFLGRDLDVLAAETSRIWLDKIPLYYNVRLEEVWVGAEPPIGPMRREPRKPRLAKAVRVALEQRGWTISKGFAGENETIIKSEWEEQEKWEKQTNNTQW